jgi:hypothetical protein
MLQSAKSQKCLYRPINRNREPLTLAVETSIGPSPKRSRPNRTLPNVVGQTAYSAKRNAAKTDMVKSPAVNRVSICESKREATNLQQYRWTIVTAGSVLLDIGKPEQRTSHCTTSHPTNTDRSAWTSQRPGQKGAFGHSAKSQATKTYSVTLGQNKDWTITMQAKRRHKS